MNGSAQIATDAEVNEFVEAYYGGLGSTVYSSPVPLDPSDTALVLVDIQDCITKPTLVKTLQAVGAYSEALEPILDAIESSTRSTVQNIGAILTKCREVGIRPVHVRIQALLPGAEDTGVLHKSAGMLYPPGSADAAFIADVSPLAGEISLTKTCSGIHVGTHIDQVLRNLGVKKVIMVGFYTDQCISSSVRDLSDIGYLVDLIEDAVGAMSPQRHEYAMQSIRKIYANSETTAELLNRLDEIASE